jgi:hypothetical protein
MATILGPAPITIKAGPDSRVLPVPPAVQQPGQALEIVIILAATPFPNGSTSILLELSDDGGVTFPQGNSFGDTFVRPPAPRFANANERMSYAKAPDFVPTHVRISTNAPAQFITTAQVDVNSIAFSVSH